MKENIILSFCVIVSISRIVLAEDPQIRLRQNDSESCDAGWLDLPDQTQHQNTSCNMLSGFSSIPAVSFALFTEKDGTFTPCCGRVSVNFRAKLFRESVEIPMTGSLSLDSVLSDIATVRFR
jgi:hypothetical protein